jgi:hypothetical protein
MLHRRVEILHADRDAVEAERGQRLHAAGPELARIDLDRALGIGLEVELRADRVCERAHLLGREKSRRTAAEMQLRHAPAAAEPLARERQFLREVLDILCRAPVIPGHHLVARAVIADRVAERQVHVQRKGLLDAADVALAQPVAVVGFAECLDKAVCRRIGRVARPGKVILADEHRIDNEFRSGISHVPTMPTRLRVPLTCVNRRCSGDLRAG